MEQFADIASATLAADITSSATSLTVSSPVRIPSSGTFRVRIDSEIIAVTSLSGDTWTITRPTDGSAASHASGATINHILTAEALNSLVSVQANGTETANRRILNFIGATVADNPTDSRVDITVPSSLEPAWTAPILANFTWLNQGSATCTTGGGNSLFLQMPASGSGVIRGLFMPLISAPYKLIACVRPLTINASNNTFFGLAWYNSSSGALITLATGKSNYYYEKL